MATRARDPSIRGLKEHTMSQITAVPWELTVVAVKHPRLRAPRDQGPDG
eukprot:CAMPEP_0113670302 /NCGR_PEP_ID=MMETSP0038_2-20120614/5062_1 /TAXON_ID=2898 /ORGANISM="Cryptomonas paramecium" /LENGTH=48 /DNA_ID=CAMNT_0000586305 /DNA_START=134 /DNA_END=280 /DNA_ORIENTATION=+ /assembly_acc=CAM_ASM_000170